MNHKYFQGSLGCCFKERGWHSAMDKASGKHLWTHWFPCTWTEVFCFCFFFYSIQGRGKGKHMNWALNNLSYTFMKSCVQFTWKQFFLYLSIQMQNIYKREVWIVSSNLKFLGNRLGTICFSHLFCRVIYMSTKSQ